MKNKIKLIFISFIAIMLFDSSAYAATIPVFSLLTDKNTVTVGDVVTASVKVTASQNNVLGCYSFTLDYDTSKLILLGNSGLKISGECGDGSQTSSDTYKFKFKAIAPGTAKIYVDSTTYFEGTTSVNRIENVSKGSKSINVVNKTTAPTVRYSKNNNLSSLEIEGYKLEPEFNKDKLEYTITLPKETYKIKLNAKTEDSKASVSGIGEITLVDGENKLEVKVTAENGNVKTYVIKATVEEPNPINVKIDDKEYTVVRKKDGLTIPTNYRETTIDLSGESVLAFYGEITKYNLVALKDENSNINFYIYDNDTYKLYKELNFNSINIYPYQIDDDKILNGYSKDKMDINGMELEILTDNKGYPIVYGMNLNTGEISYYTYDAKENTLQRYNNEVSKKLEKENKMYFYISIALGSFCIIELLIMIIILATRSNKNVKKIEETLEKTIKMNSIKEEPISKKELKRQRKEQLKQEKLKLKEDKKKSKQKDNENMDSL